MRNAGINHYAVFWYGNNGLHCAYFVNNGLQSASMKDVFWISFIKWYKFYNNNLLVVLGSKQKGTFKLVIPKHEDWASVQLPTLSVSTFLYTLPRSQVRCQRHCMDFLYKTKSSITRVCNSVLFNAGLPAEYLPKQIRI